MSLNTILRQKQIREMLDYDLVQNKRVFDNEIKHVETLNEAEAPPRKSDIEFEAEVKSNVDNIVLQFQKLVNSINGLENVNVQSNKVILPEFYDDEGESVLGATGDIGNLADFEGFGRFRNSVIKGGNKELELTKYLQKLKDNTLESISGIYSSFNGLVDKINSKLKNGYSAQGTSNIISLLQPIADNASEVLAAAYSIKSKGVSWMDFESIYQKIYSLIIEIINIIKEAPPLRRLDATRIRDDHYQGDYEAPDVMPIEDVRRREGELYIENNNLVDKIGKLLDLKTEINTGIGELSEMLATNPGHQGIIDTLQEYEDYRDELDRRVADMSSKITSNERSRTIHGAELMDLAASIESLEGTPTNKGLIDKLEDERKRLEKQRMSIQAGVAIRGKSKNEALKGIDRQLSRLETQISKANIALARDKKLYEQYSGALIDDRNPDDLDLDTTELAELPGRPNREEGFEGRDFPLRSLVPVVGQPIRRNVIGRDVAPPTLPGVLPQGPQPQIRPAPEKPGKPVRKGAEKEARAIREEERALRQAEIAQGLPAGFLERMGPGVARTDEEAEVDRLMAEIDAGLLRQGFGKRRGRPSKKGGAKAMTPDQINAIVVARNKAFAANNEATQLPRAPMTYLGLKADNTRGTLGAGKKDIVMKQKDFVKEHKKLVSLLGKTGNSLKSEAVEQTNELSKFDPETAKVLEKVVDKQKLKAGKKGKKSTKALPTLVFDDAKNDWYI